MAVDPTRCLGCGLCVSGCRQGANRLVLRDDPPRLPRTRAALEAKLSREAVVGLLSRQVRRLAGRP